MKYSIKKQNNYFFVMKTSHHHHYFCSLTLYLDICPDQMFCEKPSGNQKLYFWHCFSAVLLMSNYRHHGSYVFSHVDWLIKQKLLDGVQQSLMWGWRMGQKGIHQILVHIQMRGESRRFNLRGQFDLGIVVGLLSHKLVK